MRTITLAKGGTKEQTVNVSQIVIPDLWHIAMHLKPESPSACEKVLETWHLAHDLLREVTEWECHANADVLEALKRIRRTSVEGTFHGDVQRFQEWLDGFTTEAISKAEGK